MFLVTTTKHFKGHEVLRFFFSPYKSIFRIEDEAKKLKTTKSAKEIFDLRLSSHLGIHFEQHKTAR